jgi:hypothetical protein
MRLYSTLVITHLVCATAALDAQQLYVGPRLGTTSAVQHAQGYTYEHLHGMTAGLSATFEVNSWIAVQAEALYVRKGARNEPNLYEMSLDYLEAPVLARIGSPLGKSTLRPFLTAGVAPAEEIRCGGYRQFAYPNVQLYGSIPPGTGRLDCDSQRTRHSDFSSVFGGGVSFNNGPMQFTAEIRRTRGRDIGPGGYGCCQLRNDVTSVLIGASRRVH